MRLAFVLTFFCVVFAVSQGHGDANALSEYHSYLRRSVEDKDRCSAAIENTGSNLEKALHKKIKSLESELKSKDDIIIGKVEEASREAVHHIMEVRKTLDPFMTRISSVEAKLFYSTSELKTILDKILKHLETGTKPKPYCEKYRAQLHGARLKRTDRGIYHIHEESTANWHVAREYCEHRGMHLASFESQEEFDHILEVTPHKTTAGYWVAATDSGRKSGDYYWTDGRRVDKSVLAKDTRSWTQRGSCVNLRTGSRKLEDAKCDTKSFFICEVRPEDKLCI